MFGFKGINHWMVSVGLIALFLATAPTAALAVEAESGAVSGAARVIVNSAMSATFGVGFIGNGPANYLSLQMNVSQRGPYLMTVRYISPTARTLYWSVNGGAIGSASLNSGSSTAVGTHTAAISLNPGPNSIRFYNDSGAAPDLDTVTVEWNCPSTDGGSSSGGGMQTQAESGMRNGTASIRSFPYGGQGVGGIGNGSANWVQLNASAMSGGTQQMLIAFASEGPRTLYWTVNGVPGGSAVLNSGSSNVVGTYMTNVTVNAGANTIRFYNDTGPAPDLDYIIIGNWSGPFCGSSSSSSSSTSSSSSSSSGGTINWAYWTVSPSSVRVSVGPADSAYLHYSVNNGPKQTVRMTHYADGLNDYIIRNLRTGAIVRANMTYYRGSVARTTPLFTYRCCSGGGQSSGPVSSSSSTSSSTSSSSSSSSSGGSSSSSSSSSGSSSSSSNGGG